MVQTCCMTCPCAVPSPSPSCSGKTPFPSTRFRMVLLWPLLPARVWSPSFPQTSPCLHVPILPKPSALNMIAVSPPCYILLSQAYRWRLARAITLILPSPIFMRLTTTPLGKALRANWNDQCPNVGSLPPKCLDYRGYLCMKAAICVLSRWCCTPNMYWRCCIL